MIDHSSIQQRVEMHYVFTCVLLCFAGSLVSPISLLRPARGERKDGLLITCCRQQRLSVSQRPGRVETGASSGLERVRDAMAHVFALLCQAAHCVIKSSCVTASWGMSGRRAVYERAGDGD